MTANANTDAAFNSTHPKAQDTSIFAAFAQQGQQPIKISHYQHFEVLMKVGRPTTYIPSPSTVSRDIKASTINASFFESLTSFSKEHPGHVHFATDAWTSPNHHAFVAWTVHLHHEGHILTFLLDIMEVPEVHDILQLRLMPL
ncbi:hypothetical protein L208DRAFT_1243140 [Tricholoma matsutake]|nr:hypothetical protein L208DRAFT_1243140 [Tricholoma matsutake 945]